MTTLRSRLGLRGEELARARLEAEGMKFIRKNFFCAAGELDLILLDGREIVFVEVKTRTSEMAGAAEESISVSKGKKLIAAANSYLSAARAPDLVWRVDTAAITLHPDGQIARFTHVKNAIVTG